MGWPADPSQRWARRDVFQLSASRTHDLLLADIDGDGRQELYVWNQEAETVFWVPLPDVRSVVTGVDVQALAAADFDGDGRPEIAVCEVGADIGQPHGRLALFRPGANLEDLWEAQVVHDRLFDAHSLQVADFDGDGYPDLYGGEMGLSGWTTHTPVQRIFLSRGDRMEEQIIDTGVGTHEAQVIELDGRFGIVSKPCRALQASGTWPAGVDSLYLYLPE